MKVIVVGAGIAGLGAGTYLAARGHDVEILEARDRIGGRALTLERKKTGDRCDVGTQYYHSSYRRALALMREVGIDRTLSTIHGKTRFFDERVPGGSYLLGHRLPWFKPEGVGGNLKLAGFLLHRLLRHPMDTFALEDRPGPDGLRALDVAGDRLRLECLVRPVLRAGVLSEPETADVSLLHLVRLLRIIVLTDYLSPSGGMASFHAALAARLPVRLETPVERLVVESGRVTGVALGGSGAVLRADHVVVAATAPQAAAMCPAEWGVEREFLGSIRIPPAVIVSFFLDRPLEKDVWSYMFPAEKGRIVSFATDAARKNPAMAPSGKAILQAWPCHPASEEIQPVSDDGVADRCRREMEDVIPGVSSWIEEAHVTRHPAGVPWTPVGHSARALAFLRSADARPGVSFCGDYLTGGYLEPALWSAERAARRI